MIERMDILLVSIFLSACAQSEIKSQMGDWKVDLDPESRVVILSKGSKVLTSGMYASYRLGDDLITTKDYRESVRITGPSDYSAVEDGLVAITIKYTQKNLPTLEQNFYIERGTDYLLTDFTLNDEHDISSNYMAPVCIDSMSALLGAGDNRALFIPFDNDKWIRFQSYPASVEKLTSYEVTAIFNTESRNGLVVGSVEHGNWKTAIDMTGGTDRPNLNSLICYGVAANETTRDVKPHGALKGKSVKSPKVFIGLFDDWREGMEAYADVNAMIAPPKAWNKAVPNGWNSWGVLQFNLTYEKAIEVSDFFRDNLQNNHFINGDSLVYIGLDSGWNSFTEEELKSFADHCKANGQVAGIYWTPFTDWGKNPEKTIKDAPEYKFKDVSPG